MPNIPQRPLEQSSPLPPVKAAEIPAQKSFAHEIQPVPSLSQDHLALQNPTQVAPAPIDLTGDEQEPTPWKVSLGASHSFTKYFDTDLQLNSSRVQIEIKDFSFLERGSRDFFNPATWQQPMDALRWIDEPTNTFALIFEKGPHEVYLSAFHPKFLSDPNQVKQITGQVDGVAVDHIDHINKPFDGYNQTPGELELVRFENTHLQMEFEAGYGRQLTLLDNPKFGRLVYTPGLSAGVMTGGNYAVMIKEGAWWDFEDQKDTYRVQGFGGSLRNKLSWEAPGGRFSVFGENKTSLYHLQHGFMDGTAKYNLGYSSTALGVGIKLFGQKSPKIP